MKVLFVENFNFKEETCEKKKKGIKENITKPNLLQVGQKVLIFFVLILAGDSIVEKDSPKEKELTKVKQEDLTFSFLLSIKVYKKVSLQESLLVLTFLFLKKENIAIVANLKLL